MVLREVLPGRALGKEASNTAVPTLLGAMSEPTIDTEVTVRIGIVPAVHNFILVVADYPECGGECT